MMIKSEEIANMICNECSITRHHKTGHVLDKDELLMVFAYIRKLKQELEAKVSPVQAVAEDTAKAILDIVKNNQQG